MSAEAESKTVISHTIPLGENWATLSLHGDNLTLADFDALIEHVAILKEQFQAKQEAKDDAETDDEDESPPEITPV